MSDQMDKMEGMQENGTERTAKEKRAAKKKSGQSKRRPEPGKSTARHGLQRLLQ